MWEGDVPSETERILVKGLMDFPKRIVRQILSGPDRARFVVNLSNKVLLRTYYSGMGSEGIVLHWLANAVRAEEPALIPDDAVCWYSSCDKQSLARRVLGKYGSLGPQHVFGDMLARHDKETCATLDAVKWPADTKNAGEGVKVLKTTAKRSSFLQVAANSIMDPLSVAAPARRGTRTTFATSSASELPRLMMAEAAAKRHTCAWNRLSTRSSRPIVSWLNQVHSRRQTAPGAGGDESIGVYEPTWWGDGEKREGESP